MLLPSLVVSRFATMPPGLVTGLLLIDIGESFGLAVGVTAQVRTAASIVGVLSALLISALSLRFRAKSLLVGGLLLLVASTVGCTWAPDFSVLIVIYALTGMAGSLVGPMAFTLVADHFPFEQRANALSWIIAGMSASNLIGAPIIGYISGFAGWRGSFLWFVLPVSLFGLFLAVRFVDNGQTLESEGAGRVSWGVSRGSSLTLLRSHASPAPPSSPLLTWRWSPTPPPSTGNGSASRRPTPPSSS